MGSSCERTWLMSVVLPAPDGPEMMNRVPSEWKLLDILHLGVNVIPTLSGAKGRDLGGRVVRQCRSSYRPASQVPPLRCAQGRNDRQKDLTRHSAPARGSVRPRFSILQRGSEVPRNATLSPWC